MRGWKLQAGGWRLDTATSQRQARRPPCSRLRTPASSLKPQASSLPKGVSLVEIVIAIFVFALCVIPTIGLFELGYESATLSEDRIYAETMAARILEVWNAQPYEVLLALKDKPVTDAVQRIFNTDKLAPWFASLPEYARNLGIGKDYFGGVLEVRELDPGLLSLEVSVWWTVVDGPRKGERRQYRMIGFRTRHDISVNGEGGTLDT